MNHIVSRKEKIRHLLTDFRKSISDLSSIFDNGMPVSSE